MSKTDTALMKLVFRVGGIGCSLVVEHLVEVVEFGMSELDTSVADPDKAKLGEFCYRDEQLPVVDLAGAFGLNPSAVSDSCAVLVVAGEEGPWGAVVEKVDGVYPASSFRPVDVPIALLCSGQKLYTQLDLWRGMPLVCLEPYRIDRLRTAGCL